MHPEYHVLNVFISYFRTTTRYSSENLMNLIVPHNTGGMGSGFYQRRNERWP